MILSLDRDALGALCRRHHVRRLSLFGSVLKGTARADSDVDLLVEFFPGKEPGYLSMPPVRRWLIATIPTLDMPGLGGTRWRATFALSAHWFCGVLLTGLGLWLVWQGALMVPGAEETALDWLHAFAIWCARLPWIGT